MRVELTEVLRVTEHELVAETALLEACGLSARELKELIESGVIVPEDPEAEPRTYRTTSITVARTARRLRADFRLDAEGLALAMTLLERIRGLEAEVKHLKAQMPHLTSGGFATTSSPSGEEA